MAHSTNSGLYKEYSYNFYITIEGYTWVTLVLLVMRIQILVNNKVIKLSKKASCSEYVQSRESKSLFGGRVH